MCNVLKPVVSEVSWGAWKGLSRALRWDIKHGAPFKKNRIGVRLLSSRYNAGYAGIMLNGTEEQIVGYAALWDTNFPGIVELGTFWVHPEYRGQGVGSSVFHQCNTLLKMHNLFGIMLTGTPAAIIIARRCGWYIDSVGNQFVARLLANQDADFHDFRKRGKQYMQKEPSTLLRSWDVADLTMRLGSC